MIVSWTLSSRSLHKTIIDSFYTQWIWNTDVTFCIEALKWELRAGGGVSSKHISWIVSFRGEAENDHVVSFAAQLYHISDSRSGSKFSASFDTHTNPSGSHKDCTKSVPIPPYTVLLIWHNKTDFDALLSWVISVRFSDISSNCILFRCAIYSNYSHSLFLSTNCRRPYMKMGEARMCTELQSKCRRQGRWNYEFDAVTMSGEICVYSIDMLIPSLNLVISILSDSFLVEDASS